MQKLRGRSFKILPNFNFVSDQGAIYSLRDSVGGKKPPIPKNQKLRGISSKILPKYQVSTF